MTMRPCAGVVDETAPATIGFGAMIPPVFFRLARRAVAGSPVANRITVICYLGFRKWVHGTVELPGADPGAVAGRNPAADTTQDRREYVARIIPPLRPALPVAWRGW